MTNWVDSVDEATFSVMMDLICCLEPILVPMRLIGVDLISWNHPSARWQFVMSLYGLLWLIINLSSQTYIAYEVCNIFQEGLTSSSAGNHQQAISMYTWNVVMDFFNTAVGNSLGHFFILFMTRREWGKFIFTFRQATAELNSHFKFKVRKVTIIALLHISFMVGPFQHGRRGEKISRGGKPH